MRVEILYFGVLRDLVGVPGEPVELPDGATVGELLEILRGRTSNPSRDSGVDEGLWRSLAAAVNREYSSLAEVLREGDEVALLPPVSGGCERAMSNEIGRVEIVDAAIAAEEIVAAMKDGADGAVCVFDGIVRDNTCGRRTLYLDYESYREMALKQMRGLAAEAIARFGVRDVAMVHRLGRLMVGETSVLIVVASAHRAAAFEACRWLIDSLKKTVPIWKKETFVDGAVWADGKPFPDEIGLRGREETR
jgi:molybdopterin synthase catalytic subunit